jgi:hypothetical protein
MCLIFRRNLICQGVSFRGIFLAEDESRGGIIKFAVLKGDGFGGKSFQDSQGGHALRNQSDYPY